MIRPTLILYETGGSVSDFSSRAQNVIVTQNEHGFATLRFDVPMGFQERVRLYDTSSFRPITYGTPGTPLFTGRIEDRTLTPTGITFTAFGQWRAFHDVTYTALWSSTQVSAWRPLTYDEHNNAYPQRFEFSQQDSLTIALRKNEQSSSSIQGIFGFRIPHNSDRDIVAVQFSYEIAGVSGYRCELVSTDAEWVEDTTLLSISTNGTVIIGAAILNPEAAQGLVMKLYRNGGASTYTGNTGDLYFKITNIRILTDSTRQVSTNLGANIPAGTQTVTPGDMTDIYAGQWLWIGGLSPEGVLVESVTATSFTATFRYAHTNLPNTVKAWVLHPDQIIKGLVTYVNGRNNSQIEKVTTFVNDPGVDLLDEVYLDARPADIITALSQPDKVQAVWQAQVWEDKILRWGERGSGRLWRCDLAEMTLTSTGETLYNAVYATYLDAHTETRRTAVVEDAPGTNAYDLVRERVVKTNLTVADQAEQVRDAALTETATITPRIQLVLTGIFNEWGAAAPLYECRAGDSITIRNLPPGIPAEIAKLRHFVIKRLTYDGSQHMLRLTPAEDIPTVEILIANLQSSFLARRVIDPLENGLF